jgi:predicted secreted hydrolase
MTLIGIFAAGSVASDEGQASQLADLLNEDATEGFAAADAPRACVFPADHGPHEDFRNEWWYFTGNLDAADGRRFGFEFTIFRFALTPSVEKINSRWRTNQVYIAHFALTDVDDRRFHVAERYSRGALGLAGASTEPFRVWIDDWTMFAGPAGEPWHIVARDGEIGIELELRPQTAPVLNGDDGLSRKSHEIDSASYYYSMTRWDTAGFLRVGGERVAVSGLSWLDREWSTSALAPNQVGWDWFALQLADGTDIMLYDIRRLDGSADPASSGTLSLPDGTSHPLRSGDFEIVVRDTWESPAGGRYPSRWTVRVPAHAIEADVTPVLADQELFTTVRYWEGAVDVRGRSRGAPVEGRGYVELTGYAE